MLEAEGKLAGHLQIVMHDWPRESKQNTIDHVLAALKEQRDHEREACATRLTMDANIERETAARLERSPHEQDVRQAEKHILAADALDEAAEAIRNRT
jgi:hypothetical protein